MTREEKIIDELCRLLSDYERNQPREEAQKERYRWAVKEVTEALKEQKIGKWVMSSYGEHKCSKCGRWAGDEEHLSTKEKEKKLTRFCPNCGAKMKGAEE